MNAERRKPATFRVRYRVSTSSPLPDGRVKQGSRGDFEKISEGKRRNRFERRKAKTCNLPRSLSSFDEQPVARQSRFDDVILRSERDERSLFFLSAPLIPSFRLNVVNGEIRLLL